MAAAAAVSDRADTLPGHWAATVRLRPGQDPEAVGVALWRAGALGSWTRGGEVVGWFDLPPEDLDPAALDLLPDDTAWRHEPAVDHLAAWRASVGVVVAGPFDVVPTHLADDHETPPGRHRIVLDPGQAFGSGHHDTTAGCLEALADLPVAGRSVLDVGTGTGILAIAARLLGADPVRGVDTDPDAVAVARHNAVDNDVAVDLAVGSLPHPPGEQGAGVDAPGVATPAEVVLANLLTHTVVALADDLFAATATGGHLVASGVGAERGAMVATALADAGYRDVEVRRRGDWVVLTARRA